MYLYEELVLKEKDKKIIIDNKSILEDKDIMKFLDLFDITISHDYSKAYNYNDINLITKLGIELKLSSLNERLIDEDTIIQRFISNIIKNIEYETLVEAFTDSGFNESSKISYNFFKENISNMKSISKDREFEVKMYIINLIAPLQTMITEMIYDVLNVKYKNIFTHTYYKNREEIKSINKISEVNVIDVDVGYISNKNVGKVIIEKSNGEILFDLSIEEAA